MGNGSGPGRFASRIYTNSWSNQVLRSFANEHLLEKVNS